MKHGSIKNTKRRLNKKKFGKFILLLLFISVILFYFFNLKIKHIEINGTTYLTDAEIIDAAGISDYPPIFGFNSISITNGIKHLDLVSDVKISKNIFGKLTINVTEAKVLFYNKAHDKIVLSSGKEVNYDTRFLGVPTLLNYVPDDIYKDLITGLSKIDNNILSMISEIEYSPSKAQDDSMIDDTRFLLRMNDKNTVYMNTINILQLNKYIEICSAIIATQGNTSGILYLDSSTEENYSFEAYKK
jgi:cell division protein FtsQ